LEKARAAAFKRREVDVILENFDEEATGFSPTHHERLRVENHPCAFFAEMTRKHRFLPNFRKTRRIFLPAFLVNP